MVVNKNQAMLIYCGSLRFFLIIKSTTVKRAFSQYKPQLNISKIFIRPYPITPLRKIHVKNQAKSKDTKLITIWIGLIHLLYAIMTLQATKYMTPVKIKIFLIFTRIETKNIIAVSTAKAISGA